ncbi:S9 family peptidase [Caulobacter sp. 17J80-11]|uniref:S9 family peptidase n=1 Tax=Caulobacter sp. 17J80-11 TaxID=2763502 RepID=UPI001653AF6A|nr:S9 family peptidase [Caulobacter sp. 17J80-11]MBC6980547.1 S9 family peptidase [Caulobacter sp. 17J80-11]
MSRLKVALLSAALFVPAFSAHADGLTPERVFADPGLNGRAARGVALSPDGQLVTYLKAKDEDQNVLDLWAADVKGGEPHRLIDARALAPADKDLSEAEKARRERMRVSSRGVVEYHWDEEGRFILAPLDGDLWLAQRADGKVRRLTETPGDEVDAKVSPKGTFVSYVRDQNLYVTDLASGREQALSTDGKNTLSWGVAEFVAQEEMDRDTGYWWSPDETKIALTRVDESPVDVIPRLDVGAEGARIIDQRYPRAGRPNAIVELYVHDMARGQKVKVDLGPNTDIYLARVTWSRDGKTLYVQRQSRDQRTLDLLAVDPSTGAARTLLTETSPHWVELTDDFKPLKDGTFLWSSERSGWRHLYLYGADGRVVRQVTTGDWPVDKIEGVDEAKGLVLFGASKDTPLERQLYSVSYKRGGASKPLTQGHGWWTTTVADAGGAFAGTYSDLSTPPRTGLYAPDGKLVRWIEPNTLDASHPYFKYLDQHRAPSFGAVKASDGTDLQYALYTPAGFDPSKKYPVIVSVYGGPHVQNVKRAWGSPNDQLLLQAGYVLFRLDNRGSANRSEAFKTAIDRKLGTVEVEDQLAGVTFLKTLPYVDPNRIGVMGWSYGGFMTLMLLTEKNSPFAAGAAGAPPTDWSLYDTHYTEQFMGKPEENKDGYARSEVIPRLKDLKGDLLLLQGMADDNVTFDNSTRVMEALQAGSRPFETMVYPGQRHGVRGNAKQLHLWRTYLDFFRRKLQPGS